MFKCFYLYYSLNGVITTSAGGIFECIIGLLALTFGQCVDTSISKASTADVEGVTRKYSINREAARSSPSFIAEKVTQSLWKICEGLTSNKSIPKNVQNQHYGSEKWINP